MIVTLAQRYPKTPDSTIGLWAAYAADFIFVEDYRKSIDPLYEIYYVGVKETGEQSASNVAAFHWAIAKIWM
ncbi:hypothetical protein HDU67_003150, partial [Dinochytrium kinnereticum]